jgi:hypothetical protein
MTHIILGSIHAEFQIYNNIARYKITLTDRVTKTSKTLYQTTQTYFSITQIRKPLSNIGIDIDAPNLYYEDGEIGYTVENNM